MSSGQRFFGTPSQQAVTRRAAALWCLVKDDPRYSTHGRAIGLNARLSDDIELHLALARLQGIGPIDDIADADADIRDTELRELGLITDRYAYWLTGDTSLRTCADLVAAFRLPDDLEPEWIDPDTPIDRLHDLAELLAACEMMLPMENVVRGIALPSVYVLLKDRSGRPVAHASSTRAHHPDAPNGGEAHWGMLATLPERRGQGLAAYLGALAMVEMNRRYGFRSFGTGIREGNTPSEALCTRLGLAATGRSVLLAIDPALLDGDKLTK
ncbi:MAG: GNAT family N-acetyltransferase [Minwuia sp.]|uniref:GNAT family N-acetyltransferase n=1 Tax=Minwuia sp. TaxID=2493630 RepID=UPI003A844F00